MNRSVRMLPPGLVLATMAATSLALAQAPPASDPALARVPSNARAAQAAVPPEAALPEEEFAIYFRNQPGGYFHQARWACMNSHHAAAAASIRKAAAQLRLEALRETTSEDRRALLRCATDLETLAGRVGTSLEIQPTLATMDAAFARSHLALARHQRTLARDRWARREYRQATRHLRAASENVETGFAWGGIEPSPSELGEFTSTSLLMSTIEHGSAVSDRDFEKCMTGIENQLKRLPDSGRFMDQRVEASTGAVTAEGVELIWLTHADEPATQFTLARQAILARRNEAALTALQRAEAFLRMQSHLATGATKASLLASAESISGVAYDLESDVKVSVFRTDQIFARAEVVMADYYRHRAIEAHDANDAVQTGNFLHAAALHLERGVAWTGQKLNAGAAFTVSGTRFLSGRLLTGAEWTVDEVRRGIDALATGIDAAREWISPRTPAPASGTRPSR